MGTIRLSAYHNHPDISDEKFMKYDMPINSRILVDDIEQVIIENESFDNMKDLIYFHSPDRYVYSIMSF